MGHTNVWAPFTVDVRRGLVYLPFGTPSNDWYGGERHGNNLFAESIVCLDAKTGRRVWHYQITHHGLWDYDMPSPPVLATIHKDGRAIDIVAQVTKQGWVFVFDRVTGQPVWPIEERPVPASDVPGERAAATQPVPTKPPAFAKQGFTEDDVIDFTPEVKRLALEEVRQYRTGSALHTAVASGDDRDAGRDRWRRLGRRRVRSGDRRAVREGDEQSGAVQAVPGRDAVGHGAGAVHGGAGSVVRRPTAAR